MYQLEVTVMGFNIICNKTILKSFIQDALLYIGMARVRVHYDARANGIRWMNSFFFLIIFVSDDRQIKKHKCINYGSYGHGIAWFRAWIFVWRSIIKAYAYCLKITNSIPDKFWASTICFCVKQVGSWCLTICFEPSISCIELCTYA